MHFQRMLHALLLSSVIAVWAAGPLVMSATASQETPTVRTAPPQQMEPPAKQVAPPQNSSETERYTLSHERYEKAVAYSRAGYTLYFLSVFIGFAVLFLALRFGLVARIRDFAQRKTENRLVQGLLFLPLLLLVLELADLPVHIAWHALSLHFQQSVQNWESWFLDWGKSELLVISFLTVMGLLLYFVTRLSPRRWWFYFWLAALPIAIALVVLEPVIIDPLFHKFEPLTIQQPELATSLQKLTQRAGLDIPRERMFLMDASTKTNQINAYVTGFGSSKRVVIYDNLINKMTPDETLFVFGHESGHYVLNHVQKGIAFFALGLLITLYVTYRLLQFALDRWGQKLKIYGPHDWAALAVLLLILQGVTFFASPIANGYSRMQEHDADIFGLELIHGLVPNSAQVAAHAFQAMGELDLADPNPPPFITFWMYSHPPLAERLVFAHTYDPWGIHQSPQFVKSQK